MEAVDIPRPGSPQPSTTSLSSRPPLRLFVALPVALFATQVVAGGVDLLLASALDRLGSVGAVTTFGAITGAAALLSLVAYPLGGGLSDRTPVRFGRRSAWVAIGAVVSASGLGGLALAHSGLPLAVSYVIAWASLPLAVIALYASVPDRVSPRHRGAIGSLIGVATIVGGVAGNLVAARFSHEPALGAALFAAILVGGACVFVGLGGEPRHPSSANNPVVASGAEPPVSRWDLTWVTIGRFSLFVAYVAIGGLAYYVLRDYAGELDPAIGVAAFSAVSGLTTLLSTVIAGPWSDRIARRKPFVVGACLLVGLGSALPLFSPTLLAFLFAGAVIGLGFGTYLAVGTALASLVLPDAAANGRDIGLVGLSNGAAQVVAPLVGSAIAAWAGYPILFLSAGAAAIVAALSVVPIRSVS